MKKGKGGKEKQNEYQNTFSKEGDVITKRIPKRYKNKSYTKTNYNKMNTNTKQKDLIIKQEIESFLFII